MHNANAIVNVGGMQNANTNYSKKANGPWNHRDVVSEMDWISLSKVFKPHVLRRRRHKIDGIEKEFPRQLCHWRPLGV